MDNLLQNFTSINIIAFFFKPFAVVLSAIYIIYAIVFLKQTQVMNRALTGQGSSLIALISTLQLVASILLLILAFAIL